MVGLELLQIYETNMAMVDACCQSLKIECAQAVLSDSTGCGALMSGFISASMVDAKQHWAVDSWDKAVDSYMRNIPGASVIHSHCEAFLLQACEVCGAQERLQVISSAAMKVEAEEIRKDLLPKKHQVDLIVSGNPCQVRDTCRDLV